MRKIFTLTIFLFCSFLFKLPAQCVLDGSDANVTQAEVISCVTGHPCSGCSIIQITGSVNMEGVWDLTSLGDLTLEILGPNGNLRFEETGGNADELILTTGSTVSIPNMHANALELVGGGGGNIRITIGTKTYKGNDFPGIIAAGGANSSGLLPVELTRFAARAKDKMVELSWSTASELNNDFFQVEHSRDGVSFSAIGKLKGAGTTFETVEYAFLHRQPILGTNYYRLKQVDYDGAFEYSNVIVEELGRRTNDILIYPNPTINRAVIVMNERPEKMQLKLSNLLGQNFDLPADLSDNGWELDLSGLAKGIYMLRMEYDGKTMIKRIVKE